MFDRPSMDLFLHDLNQAYTTGQLFNDNDNTTLRYLDYAIIEHQMPMSAASLFWHDTLHDCRLDRPLPLPYDRHRLTNEHQSGRGTSISYDLSEDLTHKLLFYTTSHNIPLQQLSLTIYYAFLFKLTNGERDLCIAMNVDNRYKDELKSMIGLFENTIPLRCQLDPHWSFHQLTKHVIGMMAIEMVGGVYCPLSPRDPQQRLYVLVQQTHSRLVLLHHLTRTKFQNDIISLDIDLVMINSDFRAEIDTDQLSITGITSEDIAYIIFTSGSTGIPKAAQIRHRNVIQCTHSMFLVNAVNEKDTVIQIARCSFDVHVLDIMGTLQLGGTLIMLHPDGILDLEYFASVLARKQVTYIQAVPSLLRAVFTFIRDTRGEPCTVDLCKLITNCQQQKCAIWNFYGPAETIICTYHCIELETNANKIPIGLSMPNYRCLVLDEYLQSMPVDQEGELYVGGVGVFAGYLRCADLTAQVLIEVDDKTFYRTGDLVRVDNNGWLHYVTRKDFQVKLHGQRIELGEIERCLLNTSISACVVSKWNEDHLVAYIQSSDVNEKQLRRHCQSHLPPHMVPSFFVLLDKLPLNANGKIDRKLLSPSHFSQLSSTLVTNSTKSIQPTNEIEFSIHRIWCDLFQQKQISTNTSIFSIGGHSLLLMQLLYRYKNEFDLQTNILSVSDLFQHPTILTHAQLIHQTLNITQKHLDHHQWYPLHLTLARASLAQERIILHEQIAFSSKNTTKNMYVIPFLYRIASASTPISVSRLCHAFQSLIAKHSALRTALYVDVNGAIVQHCIDATIIISDFQSHGFSMINLNHDNNRRTTDVIKEILDQADLFDLSKGRVIRCHVLRRSQSSVDNVLDEAGDVITNDDLILISVHHAMFDGTSVAIFLHDLSLAYDDGCLLSVDKNALEYIDYSVYEQIIDMTSSREFWKSQLEECNLERSLSLPIDRSRSSSSQRSGLAATAQITFDNETAASFLDYASEHHLTPFQLGLATFYVFLYKMTHGQTDLCISCLNANRYRSELQDVIGMFVSTLPYRMQLDSYWSFDELVKHVREKCLTILEHSHYPLQHILADHHLNQSNASFLETMFDFVTTSDSADQFCLSSAHLEQEPLEQSYDVA
ncbi:unnamed protein product, partial [Adineta steineri]